MEPKIRERAKAQIKDELKEFHRRCGGFLKAVASDA
jgi:hypothetical protein